LEAFMTRLITRGRFTRDYFKGLLAAPEDREPAVRKLIEAAGVVTEADEGEAVIAALMAAAAAGTIADLTTSRAWTGKEFKAVAEKGSKAAKAYRVPGKQ
jgi:uncharacterized protein with GYD domain